MIVRPDDLSPEDRAADVASDTMAEKRDHWISEAHTAWRENAELRVALANLLPYAIPTIGLPRESWPTDSVILVAERLLARSRQ